MPQLKISKREVPITRQRGESRCEQSHKSTISVLEIRLSAPRAGENNNNNKTTTAVYEGENTPVNTGSLCMLKWNRLKRTWTLLISSYFRSLFHSLESLYINSSFHVGNFYASISYKPTHSSLSFSSSVCDLQRTTSRRVSKAE